VDLSAASRGLQRQISVTTNWAISFNKDSQTLRSMLHTSSWSRGWMFSCHSATRRASSVSCAYFWTLVR